MSSCQLYPEFQSACRKFHRRETALLHVWNEILMNMNEQQVTLLVFLDLSADQVWRVSRLLFRSRFCSPFTPWVNFFTIISHHLPSIHCYTNDTQLYLDFKPVDTAAQDTAVSAMKACLRDIGQWMIKDKFMINDEKTELWLLELRHSGHESLIIPNDKAIRNLAVWLQSTFSICSHVPRTCKSAFLLPPPPNIRRNIST